MPSMACVLVMSEQPKFVSVTIRLPRELYAKIKDDADLAGQKIVMWFTRAALAYLGLPLAQKAKRPPED